MKKLIVITVPVVVVSAAALLAFIIFFSSSSQSPTPSGKLMSIESYVSEHIVELSPKKEVLGGTFYVTDISVHEGKGTVSYEDGHNAYTADFTYSATDHTGISIKSFVVRK